MNEDDVLAARARRLQAWRQCAAGEISVADLFAILRGLRKRFGDQLYGRG